MEELLRLRGSQILESCFLSSHVRRPDCEGSNEAMGEKSAISKKESRAFRHFSGPPPPSTITLALTENICFSVLLPPPPAWLVHGGLDKPVKVAMFNQSRGRHLVSCRKLDAELHRIKGSWMKGRQWKVCRRRGKKDDKQPW